MRHLFILNPHAGKYDRSHELAVRFQDDMDTRALRWETAVTQYPGHATEIVRTACETGEELRIYACGGDGTLSEVCAGAAGYQNAAVTCYPAGSGNDFIRMFGPDAWRFGQLSDLLDGEESTLDLIDCNGRLALNVCSVGFDARIGLGMAEFKNLPMVGGVMAYQLSAVKNIIKGIHRPYRVEIDGEVFEEDFTLLCACNGRYYGGGFNPSPDAMPDDGLLHFVLIRAVSRLTVAKLINKYAKGGAADMPGLAYLRAGTSMKIQCDRVSMVNVDGERMDTDSISISLSAKKLRFIYPRGTHWNPALRHPIFENRRELEKKRDTSSV